MLVYLVMTAEPYGEVKVQGVYQTHRSALAHVNSAIKDRQFKQDKKNINLWVDDWGYSVEIQEHVLELE